MSGLYPIYLSAQGCVTRGLSIACPVCREPPGRACRIEDGKPVVHDARESLAYNGKKNLGVMNDDAITEYVDLCEQLTATELLDHETADAQLYARFDELWYAVLTDEERAEAEDRLVFKARAWHDARRTEDS